MNLNTASAAASTAAHTADLDVRPDSQAKHYVLACDGGFSCLGFENARAHAEQIAALLSRPDLAIGPQDFGQVSGYRKYQRAVQAWCDSPQSKQTYFDPHTPAKVRQILERYRLSGSRIRLVRGDPQTGRDWVEENDLVGTIGRSMGPMRVPLLISAGEYSGGAILTACIVRLIDWDTQRELYRHPSYQAPAIELKQGLVASLPWEVIVNGGVHARFSDDGRAGAYIAFLRGRSVSPECFQ